MKKRWLYRLMAIMMIAVSTQQMHGTWYNSLDDFKLSITSGWNSFTTGVTTQWNSFSNWVSSWFKKSPEQLAAASAFQTKKDIEFAAANLKGFTQDVEAAKHANLGMTLAQLKADEKNKPLIKILDSITDKSDPRLYKLINLPWQEVADEQIMINRPLSPTAWELIRNDQEILKSAGVSPQQANAVLNAVKKKGGNVSVNDLKNADAVRKLVDAYYRAQYKHKVREFKNSLPSTYPTQFEQLKWADEDRQYNF